LEASVSALDWWVRSSQGKRKGWPEREDVILADSRRQAKNIAAKLVAMALITLPPALLHLPLATSASSSSAASRPHLISLSLPSRSTGINNQRRGSRKFAIRRAGIVVRGMAGDGGEVQTSSKVEEKLGVRIERNPSESRLSELGIRSWPKYDTPLLSSPLL